MRKQKEAESSWKSPEAQMPVAQPRVTIALWKVLMSWAVPSVAGR